LGSSLAAEVARSIPGSGAFPLNFEKVAVGACAAFNEVRSASSKETGRFRRLHIVMSGRRVASVAMKNERSESKCAASTYHLVMSLS
jgi:hypothetical protein